EGGDAGGGGASTSATRLCHYDSGHELDEISVVGAAARGSEGLPTPTTPCHCGGLKYGSGQTLYSIAGLVPPAPAAPSYRTQHGFKELTALLDEGFAQSPISSSKYRSGFSISLRRKSILDEVPLPILRSFIFLRQVSKAEVSREVRTGDANKPSQPRTLLLGWVSRVE
ncbi:hypothetical protein KM043_006057, partial [Ampulex compressa]